MGPRPRIPKRGEIYSIDLNPVSGREVSDRHDWSVLTPEAVNVHGVAIAVVVSTAAQGARASGLTVTVRGDGVTGMAICTQVRAFDLRAGTADGTAAFAGKVDSATVHELGARIASLIDP